MLHVNRCPDLITLTLKSQKKVVEFRMRITGLHETDHTKHGFNLHTSQKIEFLATFAQRLITLHMLLNIAYK